LKNIAKMMKIICTSSSL